MAGLIFWHKSQQLDSLRINRVFLKLGYKSGKFLEMGDWYALVFPKNKYDVNNWYIQENNIICGRGTFSYKGKIYDHALKLILKDLQRDKLDLSMFWGSFNILAFFNGKITLIRDGACLARLYGTADEGMFSTSFAGLIRSCRKTMRINKDAICELLATGLIHGSDTIVVGVNFIGFEYVHKTIDFLYSKPDLNLFSSSQNEAVNQQLETARIFIKKMITDWLDYAPNSLLNLSLTAGLDSRLLLAIVHAVNSNYTFYTYWRTADSVDPDFKIALAIANSLNKPIYYKEIRNSTDLNEEQLANIFEENFISCDGVVRPGSFWDEELTSMHYRSNLAPNPHLRIMAFEGEQYRNVERVPLQSSRTLQSWIRWDMIYRFAGNNFISKQIQSRIEEKILSELERSLKTSKFNLITYREYYRHFVVPSYRSLQLNIENRFGFCSSPFADANLSFAARFAYPFLGHSLEFELAMLNSISPNLAKLPNDYGFDFSRGEPGSLQLGVKIWQSLPPSIKHRLFSVYRNYYRDEYVHRLEAHSAFIKSLLHYARSLNIGIDIDKMSRRRIRGKLVLNIGYFLKANEEWIKW